MKWFKHHSDASLNDKMGKLEDQFGLVGYAAYFKILELCASNWDGEMDPVFSFSSKQIQNKLRMKSKQTDLVLGLLSELNLFQISKCNNELIIKAPKLAEIKARSQKKATQEQPESNPIKKRREEKRRDNTKEKEKLDSGEPSDEVKSNAIGESWNIMAKENGLPCVKLPMSKDRVGLIKQALTEFPSPKDWDDIIWQVPCNPFRMGQNDRSWKANFSWLFRKTSYNYRLLWEEARASMVISEEEAG